MGLFYKNLFNFREVVTPRSPTGSTTEYICKNIVFSVSFLFLGGYVWTADQKSTGKFTSLRHQPNIVSVAYSWKEIMQRQAGLWQTDSDLKTTYICTGLQNALYPISYIHIQSYRYQIKCVISNSVRCLCGVLWKINNPHKCLWTLITTGVAQLKCDLSLKIKVDL